MYLSSCVNSSKHPLENSISSILNKGTMILRLKNKKDISRRERGQELNGRTHIVAFPFTP